ncbi:hypothetical protein IWQ62_006451, partial [Dispira parvispora]
DKHALPCPTPNCNPAEAGKRTQLISNDSTNRLRCLACLTKFPKWDYIQRHDPAFLQELQARYSFIPPSPSAMETPSPASSMCTSPEVATPTPSQPIFGPISIPNRTSMVTPRRQMVGQKRLRPTTSNSPLVPSPVGSNPFATQGDLFKLVSELQAEKATMAKQITNLTEQIVRLTATIDKMASNSPATTNELAAPSTAPTTSAPTEQPAPFTFMPSVVPAPTPCEDTSVAQVDTGNKQVDLVQVPKPVTTKPRVSYAEMVAKRGIHSEEDQREAIQAIKNLRPKPFGSRAASTPVLVYVQGIGRQRISELRKNLQKLRFSTSLILNVSFLGNRTAEFCIAGEYQHRFEASIRNFESLNWKVLKDFDASKAADPKASAETVAGIRGAFINRVHRIITTARNSKVTEIFSELLTKNNLPLPVIEPEQPASPQQATPSSPGPAAQPDDEVMVIIPSAPSDIQPMATSEAPQPSSDSELNV